MRNEDLGETLFLWHLGNPASPQLIGTLRQTFFPNGVALTYSKDWLRHGFALSEDLPLISGEFMPQAQDTAVGAVDDARPDRWGERVIRQIDRPKRLAILDMLYYAGDNRVGALGVSTSELQYLPVGRDPLPQVESLGEIFEAISSIQRRQNVEPGLRRVIEQGGSVGGARPKALIQGEDGQWIVKFSEPEHAEEPLLEYAFMSMAKEAGIRVPETKLIPLATRGYSSGPNAYALAVKRFDRGVVQGASSGEVSEIRYHQISAKVAFRAAGIDAPSYPELAQLLRRLAPADQARTQMRELFRRMVFNILSDNTDDHEKNHALLMNPDLSWSLSPAYDIVPTCNGLGYQSMEVGEHGTESSIENALSSAANFGLSDEEAREDACAVARAISRWPKVLESLGASPSVMAEVAQGLASSKLDAQCAALINADFEQGSNEILGTEVEPARSARPRQSF